MKRYGPDSLESWIISISCCFINMMMFGMIRLSGVLFVASTSRFNANRNMASLPYTFASFMRNISGPLVGFLGHRYGVRAVTTIGCLLGTIGTGACYFAENIATVTVLWGATFGFGFGLGSILLPLSINQYFDKHRATASGISFSGAGLGSFLLPPIVEIFIETYGLSGTYLLLSGFILNCVPAALLLRKPTFDIRAKAYTCRQYATEIIESVTNAYPVQNVHQKLQVVPTDDTDVSILPKIGNNEKDECILKLDRNIEKLLTELPVDDFSICDGILEPSENNEGEIRTCGGNETIGINLHTQGCLDLIHHNIENDVTSARFGVLDHNYHFSTVYCIRPVIWTDKNPLPSSKHVICSNSSSEKEGHVHYGFNTSIGEPSLNHNLEIPLDVINTENTSERSSVSSRIRLKYSVNSLHQQNGDIIYFSSAEKKNTINCPRNVSKSTKSKLEELHQTTLTTQLNSNSETGQQKSMGFSNIISDPMFNLITFTNGIYCFTFVSLFTVVVDFARDLEVGQPNEKYVIMSMSLGDLIGRLALGWITDRSYMTTTAFAALCFAFQGISIAAIVWSNGFLSLISLVALYGLSEAGIMVIYPVIISQYIDKDKQTVAIPSSNFLSGPLCLAVAPMIGYFRDEVGTYDYMLYGLSILSAACSLVMLLAPKITRCVKVSRDSDISL